MDFGEKVFGLLFLLFVGLFISFVIFSFTGLHISTGEGQHTGYITAVQKQGIVWKTWRAYVKTDAQSSQEDMYCITDESLVPELQKAAEEKRQVTVQYFSWLFAGIANCEGEPDIIKSLK